MLRHVRPLPHQDVAIVVEVAGPEVQAKGPLTSISGGNGSTHPRQPEVRQMTVPTEVHGTGDRQDADAVFPIHRETIDEAVEVVDNFRWKPEILVLVNRMYSLNTRSSASTGFTFRDSYGIGLGFFLSLRFYVK